MNELSVGTLENKVCVVQISPLCLIGRQQTISLFRPPVEVCVKILGLEWLRRLILVHCMQPCYEIENFIYFGLLVMRNFPQIKL